MCATEHHVLETQVHVFPSCFRDWSVLFLCCHYRSNLISNMARQYEISGYVWEQYEDKTGRGKVRGHMSMGTLE